MLIGAYRDNEVDVTHPFDAQARCDPPSRSARAPEIRLAPPPPAMDLRQVDRRCASLRTRGPPAPLAQLGA